MNIVMVYNDGCLIVDLQCETATANEDGVKVATGGIVATYACPYVVKTDGIFYTPHPVIANPATICLYSGGKVVFELKTKYWAWRHFGRVVSALDDENWIYHIGGTGLVIYEGSTPQKAGE